MVVDVGVVWVLVCVVSGSLGVCLHCVFIICLQISVSSLLFFVTYLLLSYHPLLALNHLNHFTFL